MLVLIYKNNLDHLLMLNLMYITKRPEIAQIAENVGLYWIFIDWNDWNLSLVPFKIWTS